MNILICGLGSIGKRHARLLRANFPQYNLFALRTYKGQEKNDLAISELGSWKEVDGHRFDVAFITNPTFLHTEYAIQCAERGINLFVEKPIDCKLVGFDRLLSLIEKQRLTAYVAYPLRYHPLVKELKSLLSNQRVLHSRAICASFLPQWRPGQNHLESYSSHSEKGGGVILDLSHDIDMVSYLFGEIKSIKGSYGRISSVTVDSEDYADLIITHSSGTTNLHLDYFSRCSRRFVEADTEEFYVKADLIGGSLELAGGNGKSTKEFSCQQDEMYVSQLKYFFDNYDNSKLNNNLFEAGRLFRKIIEFKENSCTS